MALVFVDSFDHYDVAKHGAAWLPLSDTPRFHGCTVLLEDDVCNYMIHSSMVEVDRLLARGARLVQAVVHQ